MKSLAIKNFFLSVSLVILTVISFHAQHAHDVELKNEASPHHPSLSIHDITSTAFSALAMGLPSPE